MINKYALPAAFCAAGLISSPVMAGDFALGYQFGTTQPYNIALEVFGQTDVNKQQSSAPVYQLHETHPELNEEVSYEDLRTDFDWTTGVRLRPGYNVTKNTRLFLDGGVVWGDFSMELTDAQSAELLATNADNNQMLMGFRYGAGIEHHLREAKYLSLVLNYSMTEFEEMDAYTNTTRIALADPSSDDMGYKPAYQQVNLSVKAAFDPGLGF